MKRDIGRKEQFSHTPPGFDAPEYGKTRTVWLADGEKIQRCVYLFRGINECVRRTDRRRMTA